jgi:hypothetical protein
MRYKLYNFKYPESFKRTHLEVYKMTTYMKSHVLDGKIYISNFNIRK